MTAGLGSKAEERVQKAKVCATDGSSWRKREIWDDWCVRSRQAGRQVATDRLFKFLTQIPHTAPNNTAPDNSAPKKAAPKAAA